MNAKSLSIVFVSDYLGNPASAFGHTLIYIGSSVGDVSLADYTVSFEADTDGLSPHQYLPRGLAGRLVAGYRIEPLHTRVRRYEREEQRDLWVFPLKIPQDKIDLFVAHLWELKDVAIRYGFLGDNCAQKILSIVHSIGPEYGVLPYRSIAVLPPDAVRHLVKRIGLSGDGRRRLALGATYANSVAALDDDLRAQLKRLQSTRTIPDDASTDVVYTALMSAELKGHSRAFHRSSDGTEHPDYIWRRALWTFLANREDTSPRTPSTFENATALLRAHEASRVTIRGGVTQGSPVLGFGARWLLHDALDPGDGYRSGTTLEIARVDVTVGNANPRVEEVAAISVERLGMMSDVPSVLTWKAEVGYRSLSLKDETAMHLGTEFRVGVGTGVRTARYTVGVYAQAGLRPGIAFATPEASLLTATLATFGMIARLPADVRARASFDYSAPFTSITGGGSRFNVTVRKGLAPNIDMEMSSMITSRASSLMLGIAAFR